MMSLVVTNNVASFPIRCLGWDIGLLCRENVPTDCDLQSTLVISNSKGPTKTLRDIRTSTYQICCIKEKTIRKTKSHK